ncbi:FruB Phosphotransferase system, HPr-related proteins [Candidatus Methylopumilus universalis]|uniref:Phosphocarrier protein HPr n=1 Tax=Candidatus Methylopumilus planktonicus TaxID=1581557 RepID=A0A0D6EUA0_9PROT|nr:HPr family phosphocarrier protein [Candidatus Methylopumilus planktonicus]QDC99767.1 HPr family phosphocarrier protein [Candidatus Methylopumilus planktonicus]QDD01104.1 HPr family phosphocarrier protein [Candidatus Methylopumilus planktonicus]QDD06369.1 HPr family phosphocarrier protein [Candidatus Methylopumilus planktonicus]QDD07702.1 HPr family phosphocarrier protein [Candidatus Methylopumilus planktonicus]QDD09029.1 HPr family phosphocarrier protein [Candidatus Methylopumilus planktoni
MLTLSIKIINKLGLHARASAKLTQIANQFDSDIWIEKNDKKVNAKSIMGVMMLAASQGSNVIITTEGPDEKEALNSIVTLINDFFGEGE